MNVNLHLSGEIESFINRLVRSGLAANKTEAIRLAIVRYYEEYKKSKTLTDEPMNQLTIDSVWNNPADEKAAAFYAKRYLNAKKT